MIDAEALRRQEFRWMLDDHVAYLNAASTGPLPERTVAAQDAFTRKRAAPHRLPFAEQFGVLDRSRALIAQLINAGPEDIALATNTGAGINLAAWGLPLGAGDEVVVPDAEFPANVYPWHAAATARGYRVHTVPARDGRLHEEALLQAIERRGVRVLTLSWVGFASGVVADLDRIGAACRSRGVLFVVDAIQGLGPLVLDLRRTHVDLLACGAQKWLLSPWGTGFTYVHPSLLPRITPQPVSWMGVRGSDDFAQLLKYDLTWRDDARRFEQVTLPFQDFAGMAASLELLNEIGREEVADHISRRAAELLAGARDAGFELVTPAERHAGIVSFRPGDASALSGRLDEAGIVHSVREGTIRLAPHCYTTEDDVARAIAVLRR